MINIEEVSKNEDLGLALGRVASGVYVLTLCREQKRQGMLSTWITQASFTPPMLTVAVKQDRPLAQSLEAGSLFTVNVLAKQNLAIFKAFARAHVDDEARFADLPLLDDAAEGAVFEGVIAAMVCKVHGNAPVGDHLIFMAEVLSGRPVNLDAEPMVHLRSSGFRYSLLLLALKALVLGRIEIEAVHRIYPMHNKP